MFSERRNQHLTLIFSDFVILPFTCLLEVKYVKTGAPERSRINIMWIKRCICLCWKSNPATCFLSVPPFRQEHLSEYAPHLL